MDDDWVEKYKQQLEEVRKNKLKQHKVDIESFILVWKNLGHDSEELSFDYVPTIGVVAKCPNLVFRLGSGIFQDDEGLVNCRELYAAYDKVAANPGYLYSDNYMVMLSPVFRRGLSEINNWAPRFVDLFWNVADENIDLYIALDNDRVRVNVDNLVYNEADTWFGPQFNDEISKIPDGNSKLRPPIDLEDQYIEFFFSGVWCLDVYWNTKGAIKSFQALEFKIESIKVNIDGVDYFPARYLHAEFDLDKNCFRHFDGAIQYFTPEEYYARRGSDFRHNLKAREQIKAWSKKVFKFNGQVSVEMWKDFFSHFYAANPLTHEYLTGEYPDYVKKALEKIRQ